MTINRSDGKEVKDWIGLVKHRCIIIENRYAAYAIEVKVLEVSPRGRIKFRLPSSVEVWQDRTDYLLVEDLGEVGG
uniref:Uncharacterized protein n=1 Tax=viral metagenome TaxID=1070528 RepID=A0A6M3Y3U6_9ZZZZ